MSSFDEDPREEREMHPCEPPCEGNIYFDEDLNMWVCDTCEWTQKNETI